MIVEEEHNYSQTLNLPKTAFNMKANLAHRSQFLVNEWEANNIYKQICYKNKNNKRFILHDGPPYANAHIHLGTGLNKVLKDFIVKYLSMSGYFVPFTPGWDCHGLPIEQIVIKDLNIDKNKIDKLVFREAAERFVKKFVKIQKTEFQSLGIIADWDNPYLTFTNTYEAAIINIFRDLVSKGYVYRNHKPVYWCPNCETAMAEAEVEYHIQKAKSIFIKFNIISYQNSVLNTIQLKDFSVLIWTTTPWSLPANVALAFNGEEKYIVVIYKFANSRVEKLIVAKALAYNIQRKIKAVSFEILAEFQGKAFINIKCQNPLIKNKQAQCVVASFVSIKDGTGIVHIAPGLGPEDYQVGVSYGFKIFSPFDSKGKFTKEVPEFEGIKIFHANDLIIKQLYDNQNILALCDLKHSYPYCWRCKQPIMFRATQQWFLSMDHKHLRNKIINKLKTVQWIPNYGENRIKAMLKIRPDWCLSRQRLWGVPLPIFYCKQCSFPILDVKIIDKIAELFSLHGSNSWFQLSETELLKDTNVKCPSCKNTKEFIKEQDILDVWFDSGVSFEAVLRHKNLDFPADLYLEGSDQHRGWFQTSLILSMATQETVPYKTVLTHGFVVDGEGKKMSKSLGNFISTDIMLHKYGADMIRFWIASSNYRDDIKLSDEIMIGLSDIYRKIRNTIRFLLGNLYDIQYQDIIKFQDMQKIDQYALHQLNQLIVEVITAYNSYLFHKVMNRINNFCTSFLSGFYLNALKDILYCDPKNGIKRKSAQSAILEICSVIIRLVAPILSFTAEEAWKEINKLNIFHNATNVTSVFLSNFPIVNTCYNIKQDMEEIWKKIFFIREQCINLYENLRLKLGIGSILETSISITYGSLYKNVFQEIDLLKLVLGNWDINYNLDLIKDDALNIEINKSKYNKCNRCWRHINDIENGLCKRCQHVINLYKS
ncbi:MAG: isoleucine--tRNA ligase [Endomicrobium sp.]|jgi:isoleucyl-tRNA synthetase|nr:isoleucine--tRNA ligase [Endomicrobium sp.]